MTTAARCPWYRPDEAAPDCPHPDEKGACLWCDLFPDSRRREQQPAETAPAQAQIAS